MKTKDRVKKSRSREVVSFARFSRDKPHVIPAKAGIHEQALGNALLTDWIPAFAGMTDISSRRHFKIAGTNRECL